MKQIRVVINSDGSRVEIDVNGVSGSSCSDLTKSLLSAIGSVADSKIKNEYYESVLSEVVINE